MRMSRSKLFYVRSVMIRHWEDLEDIYLAERSLNRIRSGEASTIPLEEIAERNAVED